MMVECQIWNITFIWKLSVLSIFLLYADSFNLKCPSQSSWNFRAEEKCNRTLEYFCLYNNVLGKHIEGCKGPDWDRKGNKRIYVGNFSREKCIQQRFQPFIFWTNGTTSDCIYSKSKCSEEGQIVYRDNSTKADRACRCDHTKNYSFIKTPRNVCYCIPTEEDCSCYIKSCSSNLTMSTDYNCTKNSFQETTLCKDITEYNITVEIKTGAVMENLSGKTTTNPMWGNLAAANLLCMFVCVAGVFFVPVFFSKWTEKNLQPLKEYNCRKHIDNCYWLARQKRMELEEPCEVVDVPVADPDTITKDEVRFLRLIHLLFRVACPVVRMTFNHEIQPDQLRNTLDKCKPEMEELYRKTDTIINDFQWDILFKYVQETGQTVTSVTSDDFDIRLMIYILLTRAKTKVGDLYPSGTDKSIIAMLSRIKYIRNEVTQRFERKLLEDRFNQFWDDIAQAVLQLMSSNEFNIENNQEKSRLIGRLLAINPLNITNRQLCMFIDKSERYPAMILNKLIGEYCMLKKITIDKLLRDELHQLYHKRISTESCCKCIDNLPTYSKVISDKQWEALYEVVGVGDLHCCDSNLMNCSGRFIRKQIKTYNLSVAMTLILNIPGVLTYMIDCLCVNGFDKFLLHNKHEIYHSIESMEKKQCCMCKKVPSKTTFINKAEWNKLFYMTDDFVSCNKGITDCCCKYSVKYGIKNTELDEILLCKIFHVAGPFAVLYKIEKNAFLGFLNWTVDDQPLQETLQALLSMITDETFQTDTKTSQSRGVSLSNKNDACRWVDMHLTPLEKPEEPSLQFFVSEQDGLKVKCIHIPEDLQLPLRTRQFTDITPEENYFLVVLYGLTKTVYPVIKNQLNKQCPENVLNQISTNIFKEQTAQYNIDSPLDINESGTKRIYLTRNLKKQLFSANKTEPKHFDLKLMIYILKRRKEEEGEKEYVDQLDVINNIRREIVQSSSGVLSKKRFEEMLQDLTKAVVYFGGKLNEEKLLDLQHITNILEHYL